MGLVVIVSVRKFRLCSKFNRRLFLPNKKEERSIDSSKTKANDNNVRSYNVHYCH